MELDLPLVEISLDSDSNQGKQQQARSSVFEGAEKTGKKHQNGLVARVEVFAAACHGGGHRLSGSRRQLGSKPHCSADAATIEAILMGLEPAPAATVTTTCTAPESPLHSIPETPTAADAALHTQPASPAKPQAGGKLPLLKCISSLKTKCKAAAAGLAPKPSSARASTKGGGATTVVDSDGDGSDSGNVLGEDPCEYKLSFTSRIKPSWLLGTRSKARKAQGKQPSPTAAPAPAPPSAAAAKPTTPSKHLKACWKSFCRQLRPKAAGQPMLRSSCSVSECSHLAQVGSSSRLHARFSADGSEAGGREA